MMLRKFMLIAVLTLAASPLAAQTQGSAADRRACGHDVRRYCKAVLSQGQMAIYGCLQQHMARIRPACRKVIGGY